MCCAWAGSVRSRSQKSDLRPAGFGLVMPVVTSIHSVAYAFEHREHRMSPKRIAIFDTTLRDGEQSPGASLTSAQKVEIALQLERLGVDVIEAGFPVSSPGDFEAVQEVCKVIKNATVCGLTRAVANDIDVAAEALKGAKRPRIHTGLGVSDSHLQHKLKMTREQAMERGVNAVKHAKKYVEDIEYFLEDSGRADMDYLCRVVEAVIKAGATVINVPGTTGFATPEENRSRFRMIREPGPNIDKQT